MKVETAPTWGKYIVRTPLDPTNSSDLEVTFMIIKTDEELEIAKKFYWRWGYITHASKLDLDHEYYIKTWHKNFLDVWLNQWYVEQFEKQWYTNITSILYDIKKENMKYKVWDNVIYTSDELPYLKWNMFRLKAIEPYDVVILQEMTSEWKDHCVSGLNIEVVPDRVYKAWDRVLYLEPWQEYHNQKGTVEYLINGRYRINWDKWDSTCEYAKNLMLFSSGNTQPTISKAKFKVWDKCKYIWKMSPHMIWTVVTIAATYWNRWSYDVIKENGKPEPWVLERNLELYFREKQEFDIPNIDLENCKLEVSCPEWHNRFESALGKIREGYQWTFTDLVPKAWEDTKIIMKNFLNLLNNKPNMETTTNSNTLQELKFQNFVKDNQKKIISLSEKMDDKQQLVNDMWSVLWQIYNEVAAASKWLTDSFNRWNKERLSVNMKELQKFEKILDSKEFQTFLEAYDVFTKMFDKKS